MLILMRHDHKHPGIHKLIECKSGSTFIQVDLGWSIENSGHFDSNPELDRTKRYWKIWEYDYSEAPDSTVVRAIYGIEEE